MDEIDTCEYQDGFKAGLAYACKILSGHAIEITRDYEDVFELFKIHEKKKREREYVRR